MNPSIVAMTLNVLALQEVKLNPQPPTYNGSFGYDVAVRGNVALIGEPNGNFPMEFGKATIFTAPGGDWTMTTPKTLDQPMPLHHNFGFSVALGDSCALIGAPPQNYDGETGIVYEYSLVNNTWSYSGRNVPSSGPGDGFGGAVAVSSDCQRMIVGAYSRDVNGVSEAGVAEIYERSGPGWTMIASLSQPSQGEKNWFGFSVALSPDGDMAAVGVHNEMSNLPGRAYVFPEKDGAWTDPYVLKGSSMTRDLFGSSVAVADDGTVVVGAPGEDDPMNMGPDDQTGAVYVFPGVLQGNLQAIQLPVTEGLGGGARLGTDVAIDGDLIVAGAFGGDKSPNGAIWVYFRAEGTWKVNNTALVASDGKAEDYLGSSVALSGGTVIGGAFGFEPADPPTLINSGAAYVFHFEKKKGDTCLVPEDCPTGFCVDGYCCDDACGAGAPDDCIACDASPGTCTPLESEMCAPDTTGETTDGTGGGDSTVGDSGTSMSSSSDSGAPTTSDGTVTGATSTEGATSNTESGTASTVASDSATTGQGVDFENPCQCSSSRSSSANALWLALLLLLRRRRGDLAPRSRAA